MELSIPVIIGLVQLAIKEAPDAIAMAAKVKNYIQSLVDRGLLTKGQQNQIHAELDVWQATALSGVKPFGWTVDLDVSFKSPGSPE